MTRRTRSILSILTIAVIALLVIGKVLFGSPNKRLSHKVELTFEDGHTVGLTEDRFPKDFILYLFSPDCGLCFAELHELISFSKEKNVAILFVTTQPLQEIKNFAMELELQQVETINAAVAHIEPNDVQEVFGNIAVPQSILFGKGLEVKAVRTEIISREFLSSAFE